jgi:cytochrome P450
LAKVHKFTNILLDKGESEKNYQGWSSPKNLGTWSSYFSFDIMTEIMFSTCFDLMDNTDYHYIPDALHVMMHRNGVVAQVPWLMKLKKYIMPAGKRAEEAFVKLYRGIASARVTSDSGAVRKDVFNTVLCAKDPETGKGLDMMELFAEACGMVIAGKSPDLGVRLIKY